MQQPTVSQEQLLSTRNDVADTTNIFDWTAGVTSAAVTTNTGTQASVRLETRCNAGSENSSTQAVTSALWRSGVLAPTGTLTISRSSTTLTAAGVSCVSPAVPQYLFEQTIRNGVAGYWVLNNWTTSNQAADVVSPGYTSSVRVTARCAIDDVSSTNSNTATAATWTRPVPNPSWTRYPGLYAWREFSWGASCSSGTVQYSWNVYIQGGAFRSTGGWNGTTLVNNSTFGNRGWGSWGGTASARCVANGVVSGTISGSQSG